ncbi:tautomerase family protein [Pseudomonas sp. MC6]
MVKHTGGDPKWVYVLFEDVPSSNWAVAGELFGGGGGRRRSEQVKLANRCCVNRYLPKSRKVTWADAYRETD